MRRFDKLKNIIKLNKRLNETKFSWDGNYANEDGIEESCGCEINEDEPTDVKSSQWFSDSDGERLTDKESGI